MQSNKEPVQPKIKNINTYIYIFLRKSREEVGMEKIKNKQDPAPSHQQVND